MARLTKRLHRLTHSKPHVEAFFDWVDRTLEAHGLRPKNPFITALHYARERRAGLEVFLSDPDVCKGVVPAALRSRGCPGDDMPRCAWGSPGLLASFADALGG